MARVIVVVARGRPDLFSYFDTVFAGMLDIKVLSCSGGGFIMIRMG